jgi:hypothetical protein
VTSDWYSAKQYCESYFGASLATVETQEESVYLGNALLALGIGKGWIGGHQADSTWNASWVWANGTAVEHFFWHPNEPNGSGDCMTLWNNGGMKWDDYGCYDQATFICEMECTGTDLEHLDGVGYPCRTKVCLVCHVTLSWPSSCMLSYLSPCLSFCPLTCLSPCLISFAIFNVATDRNSNTS